jgi:membrane fusion protein (multidrug efflux system)
VDVAIDAVPDHRFSAHVDSLQPGTGAVFALLPPDNATGNFTKIVQRVPVKIVFDNLDGYRDRVVPGLSCVPKIDLRTGQRK